MARELSILIVSNHSDSVEKIEAGVAQFSQMICRVSSCPHHLADQLASEEPVDVIIFEIRASQIEEDLSMCGRLMQIMPHTLWVATSEKPASDLILRTLRLGFKDFLMQPWKNDEVQQVLRRAVQLKLSQETSVQGQGKLITVFSNKGGVGTTTVACNLATNLAAMYPDRVLLCDMVLQHGDVGIFLDIKQKYTISNMIQEVDRLDRELLFNQLQKHSSGLYVLPSPFTAEESAQIRASSVSEAIDFLLSCFSFVVIDGGQEFTAQIVPALGKSEFIFVVTVPDIPSIRNTKKCLNMLEQLGCPQDRAKVIINRYDAKQRIDLSTLGKDMDFPVTLELCNDYSAAINAINQGQPITKIAQKSKLGKQLNQLALSCNGKHANQLKQTTLSQLFAGDKSGKKEKKSFFSNLKGKK